jgi:hypothetical protein
MPPIQHVSFRTPTIPIRPGSLTVVAAAMAGGQLTLTADNAGVIETAQAHGLINYDTGFVDIYFYTKTEITSGNRPSIELRTGTCQSLNMLKRVKPTSMCRIGSIQPAFVITPWLIPIFL